MSGSFTESIVESATLAWLEALGYSVLHGPDVAVGEPGAERSDPNYRDVVLKKRLRQALERLNPGLPKEALEDALRKVLRADAPSLLERNRAIHKMLVEGVNVEFKRKDGSIGGDQAWLIDFDLPENNDWLAVNQFTVVEGQHTRRPDVVVFVNGLPLAVIELKNPADENATVWSALSAASDLPGADSGPLRLQRSAGGVRWRCRRASARLGRARSGSSPGAPSAGVRMRLRSCPSCRCCWRASSRSGASSTCFGTSSCSRTRATVGLVKKMAGYHQFHAVNVAVEETLRAAEAVDRVAEPLGRFESGRAAGRRARRPAGGRRLAHAGLGEEPDHGVLCRARLILHPAMANPTIVVLTDRNDLDDQLFGTFARCRDLLRQPPVQAEDRADLRAKLAVASGGVVFTTIQKFFPEEKGDQYPVLSDRRNIVVIADEAHRSQYDFVDGFARHMRDALPHASFVGFTGTPIEKADANTRAVFGDYISIYDIQRAVHDGATVPIYYESRLAQARR